MKIKKITKKSFDQMVQSYLGVLKHCDNLKIRKKYFFKHIGMIIFLFGEDNYRSQKKLEEIIDSYKKAHKSGLNLVRLDAKEKQVSDLMDCFKVVSMFAEKKLIIINNIFSAKGGPASGWQEEFLKEIKDLEASKDIIVIYEKEKADERSKLFKTLKKEAKAQEFNFLPPARLGLWIDAELAKYGAKIEPLAKNIFINWVGNNLWQAENEIKKLAHFTKSIKKEDVQLLIKPKIENDIFKTINTIAWGDKKESMLLFRKHLDAGDHPLYLLSMIAYQIRTLMIRRNSHFSMEQLKKIYQDIFQIDSDIKTGKIDPELALELFISSL